jgi:ABC-type maltose transport system permease subunit
VIGIFTLVIMGRFFGALATGLAAGLLLAPLVVWVVELPGLRALAPRWRAAARLVLVAAPLVIVLLVAQRRFVETSSSRARPAASTAVGETSR